MRFLKSLRTPVFYTLLRERVEPLTNIPFCANFVLLLTRIWSSIGPFLNFFFLWWWIESLTIWTCIWWLFGLKDFLIWSFLCSLNDFLLFVSSNLIEPCESLELLEISTSASSISFWCLLLLLLCLGVRRSFWMLKQMQVQQQSKAEKQVEKHAHVVLQSMWQIHWQIPNL